MPPRAEGNCPRVDRTRRSSGRLAFSTARTGVEAARRDAVLARGVRLDETVPGSGLGLHIVQELAGVYGGTLALADSPLGGLRVRLTLPAAVTVI